VDEAMSETATSQEAAPILREVEGRTLPVPGVWTIDAGHSILAFECGHMALTRLRGWFTSFSGDFHIAEMPEESRVEVTIDADSIQMPNPAAVAGLKGENFLEVEKFKTLHFVSTRARHIDESLWQVAGDLTIKDTTREVLLDANFGGAVTLPPQVGGATKLGFEATTNFDRRDFGLDWNVPLAGGRLLVGNRVDLRLDVEAVLT
jgi:polyisoprenoid-binding protein YceI